MDIDLHIVCGVHQLRSFLQVDQCVGSNVLLLAAIATSAIR